VAGAAALVWAANPQLRAAQVASILEQTASGRGSWNAELGYGVLDVAAAVAKAQTAVATVAAVPAGRMAAPAAGSLPG
jgi:subtilisin family serine protease